MGIGYNYINDLLRSKDIAKQTEEKFHECILDLRLVEKESNRLRASIEAKNKNIENSLLKEKITTTRLNAELIQANTVIRELRKENSRMRCHYKTLCNEMQLIKPENEKNPELFTKNNLAS